MKRILVLLALAGLTVGCGSDDDETPKPATDAGAMDAGGGGKDGGATDGGGTDAGAAGPKVTNVGAACTSAAQCMGGASAICEATSWTKYANPGGSCTAVCSKDSECGTNGACPVGDLLALSPMASESLGTKVGTCSQTCSQAAGQPSGCRTGYMCVTIGQLAMAKDPTAMLPPLPQLTKAICVPAVGGDGGVSDGGVSDAGGMDAGH